jgi:hypothetical protein
LMSLAARVEARVGAACIFNSHAELIRQVIM